MADQELALPDPIETWILGKDELTLSEWQTQAASQKATLPSIAGRRICRLVLFDEDGQGFEIKISPVYANLGDTLRMEVHIE